MKRRKMKNGCQVSFTDHPYCVAKYPSLSHKNHWISATMALIKARLKAQDNSSHSDHSAPSKQAERMGVPWSQKHPKTQQ
jgi:hypothetical protein